MVDSRSRTGPSDTRALAARGVDRVLATRAPATGWLRRHGRGLEPRDRALLNELVLGTLRWCRRLDHVVATASGRRLEQIDRPLLAPLRIGLYQLLFLERIPDHAAVDEAVGEARRRRGRGGAGFVNAVLRKIAGTGLADWPVNVGDRTRRLGIETSHPDLLVAAWSGRYGRRRAEAMLAASNQPPRMHLLAFRDRGGVEVLGATLAAEGVRTHPTALSPLGLVVDEGDPLATRAFRRGDFYVQDAASQVAALIPPPRPGERILDAAAAPGGKSFAMLGWQEEARIVAADARPGRLRELSANLRRLDRRLGVLAADAGRPPFGEVFDRVVLDLPCSGSGILRKHPELKWRISAGELERLARQGQRLVGAAAEAVAVGGLLVVITCSIEPQENELLVDHFLETESHFRPQELDRLPAPAVERGVEATGRWRVLPSADHDGFTVHVLARHA